MLFKVSWSLVKTTHYCRRAAYEKLANKMAGKANPSNKIDKVSRKGGIFWHCLERKQTFNFYEGGANKGYAM